MAESYIVRKGGGSETDPIPEIKEIPLTGTLITSNQVYYTMLKNGNALIISGYNCDLFLFKKSTGEQKFIANLGTVINPIFIEYENGNCIINSSNAGTYLFKATTENIITLTGSGYTYKCTHLNVSVFGKVGELVFFNGITEETNIITVSTYPTWTNQFEYFDDGEVLFTSINTSYKGIFSINVLTFTLNVYDASTYTGIYKFRVSENKVVMGSNGTTVSGILVYNNILKTLTNPYTSGAYFIRGVVYDGNLLFASSSSSYYGLFDFNGTTDTVSEVVMPTNYYGWQYFRNLTNSSKIVFNNFTSTASGLFSFDKVTKVVNKVYSTGATWLNLSTRYIVFDENRLLSIYGGTLFYDANTDTATLLNSYSTNSAILETSFGAVCYGDITALFFNKITNSLSVTLSWRRDFTFAYETPLGVILLSGDYMPNSYLHYVDKETFTWNKIRYLSNGTAIDQEAYAIIEYNGDYYISNSIEYYGGSGMFKFVESTLELNRIFDYGEDYIRIENGMFTDQNRYFYYDLENNELVGLTAGQNKYFEKYIINGKNVSNLDTRKNKVLKSNYSSISSNENHLLSLSGNYLLYNEV